MTNEVILSLVKKRQRQVIQSLVALGDLEIIDPKGAVRWENTKTTDKALIESGAAGENPVDPNFLKEYRSVWPAGCKSTPKEVRNKMARFRLENPEVTDEEIIEAAKRHVNMKGRYCGYAGYFLYKRTDDGERSLITEYLEDSFEDNTDTYFDLDDL